MAHETEARACDFDGKKYLPKRRDQRFCSRECQRAAVLREYHLRKWKSGQTKRERYAQEDLAAQLKAGGLERCERLDAVAALIEAQEQVKLWTARVALRRAALERLPKPPEGGSKIRARVLKDGSPIGELEAANRFGVSSTDGLLAVLCYFARRLATTESR